MTTTTPIPPEQALTALDGRIHVSLTHAPLDLLSAHTLVKSPSAGAIVTFAGTTRDNFAGKPVVHLEYSAYAPRALRTMLSICEDIVAAHGLVKMCMLHRLGMVPVGEESILICVAAPHRQAAWRAGEEALEACKERVEVWKLEEFGGEEGGIWRANRDGVQGERVV